MLSKRQAIFYLLLGWLVFLWGCRMGIPEHQSLAAKTYTNKCGSCHSLPHPKRHSYQEWQHYLGLMQTHLEHQGMPSLTEAEQAAILGYLQQYSR